MGLKISKYKILYLGWNNTMQQCRLGSDWLVSNFAEEEVAVLVDNKLSTSHMPLQ